MLSKSETDRSLNLPILALAFLIVMPLAVLAAEEDPYEVLSKAVNQQKKVDAASSIGASDEEKYAVHQESDLLQQEMEGQHAKLSKTFGSVYKSQYDGMTEEQKAIRQIETKMALDNLVEMMGLGDQISEERKAQLIQDVASGGALSPDYFDKAKPGVSANAKPYRSNDNELREVDPGLREIE